MSNSFWEGFAQHQLSPQGYLGGELDDLSQRRKNKLTLQLKSAEIERELQAKTQPADQFALGGNILMGNGGDLSQVTNPNTQAMVGAGLKPLMGIEARSKIPNRASTPIHITERVGNQVKYVMRDRQTGAVLKEEVRGINPQFQKEYSQVESDFGVGNTIIKKARDSANRFLSDDYISRLPKGAMTTLDTLIQRGDPDAITLTTAREPFAIWLTASISGKQMTRIEQEAFLRLLPKPTDTIERANENLDILELMIKGREQSAAKAFLGDFNPKAGKTSKTDGKKNNDPLGLGI